jgi:hypothetical protein
LHTNHKKALGVPVPYLFGFILFWKVVNELKVGEHRSRRRGQDLKMLNAIKH